MSNRDLKSRLAALTPAQRERLVARLSNRAAPESSAAAPLKLSLFFFSDRGSATGPLYQTLLRAAQVADHAGLWAIWTPERHFHDFGAPYPEPSVLSAALAMVTTRLRIRAGSVVLPLHDVIRVAESWSVVDNLSQGRVGVALASGWHPDDFVLSRRPYEHRHALFREQIDYLGRLWQGDRVEVNSPSGDRVAIQIHPKPVQPRLPIWITASKNPETWLLAGRLGANVLTGLLEQPVEHVAECIRRYREELRRAQHNVRERQVTVMLHTYVAGENEDAEATVAEPLSGYLRSHMAFYETMVRKNDLGVDVDALTDADRRELVRRGVNRYITTSSLIGTPGRCLAMARKLQAIGVDEVACLVNFGLPADALFAGIDRLPALNERLSRDPQAPSADAVLAP
jgi:natural product biosynthesis luciferase-like monooxygenase protein